MKENFSSLLLVQSLVSTEDLAAYSEPYYSMFLLSEGGRFSVEGTAYEAPPHAALFLSPYQRLEWQAEGGQVARWLRFHGDYYCIEQHKEEVACNGLLFNNAYLLPYVALEKNVFDQVVWLTDRMAEMERAGGRFLEAVEKSYLQLVLALCSKEKGEAVQQQDVFAQDALVDAFRSLLHSHHQRERSVAFYAERLAVSPEVLNRRVKALLGKTATQLVQDQVVLTAKRFLHLTRKSVKEIAAEMGFADEFYFSRYFKRSTGLSPKHFRAQVGISVVATP